MCTLYFKKAWYRTSTITSPRLVLTDFEFSSVFKTEMDYLQMKYNISRHFAKTSLHYRVKHKGLKKLRMIYQSLMTKLSTPPF